MTDNGSLEKKLESEHVVKGFSVTLYNDFEALLQMFTTFHASTRCRYFIVETVNNIDQNRLCTHDLVSKVFI